MVCGISFRMEESRSNENEVLLGMRLTVTVGKSRYGAYSLPVQSYVVPSSPGISAKQAVVCTASYALLILFAGMDWHLHSKERRVCISN